MNQLVLIRSIVLPMFVNNDIRKEMYKGADANVDAQFKKLYIYHMENVSILFADIKVER
jgi:adenylate cyclase 8